VCGMSVCVFARVCICLPFHEIVGGVGKQ